MKYKEFTLENVRECILTAIRDNKAFLFNELDLQMFVARKLKEGFDCDIHFEYRLPDEWNQSFYQSYKAWGETPYFDLVLEHGGKFIAIELKYKLKDVPYNPDYPFTRFGVGPDREGITLVTDHSAENEGRYDFWKDVKRIELLTEHFRNVIGGISVFLTNQQRYTKCTECYKYSPFCFTETKGEEFLYWKRKTCMKGRSECDGKCEGTPCGEQKREKPRWYKGMNWEDELQSYVRPNFRLKRKYDGCWLPQTQGGLGTEGFKGAMDQTFYCYHVTVFRK